jgi:hypothetical protein
MSTELTNASTCLSQSNPHFYGLVYELKDEEQALSTKDLTNIRRRIARRLSDKGLLEIGFGKWNAKYSEVVWNLQDLWNLAFFYPNKNYHLNICLLSGEFDIHRILNTLDKDFTVRCFRFQPSDLMTETVQAVLHHQSMKDDWGSLMTSMTMLYDSMSGSFDWVKSDGFKTRLAYVNEEFEKVRKINSLVFSHVQFNDMHRKAAVDFFHFLQ